MNDISPQEVKVLHDRIRQELSQVIVSQERIVRLLLVSLFSRGHCLLIGVPGPAKTLLVRTLAQILHLSFKRIRFTPDLMLTDIIGSELLQERVKPASTTGMAKAVTECAALFCKRGRVVILSDFLTEHAELFDALELFMHRKFEILLLHVVDPDELVLPTVNVAKFVDMEAHEQVQVEPDEIRVAYRRTLRRVIDKLAREAAQRQISHALVNTERPYLDAIEAYLGFRGKHTMFAA